jgi:diguanylate cyclase
MRYPEPVQQANELAETTLARMRELGIPSNPQNYAIWYEYCSGTNHDLKHTIDVLLSNGHSLTPERNEQIYDRFFAEQVSGRALGWASKIEETADRILAALSTAGSGTESYGEALESFSGGIAGAQTISEIRDMVARLVDETKAVSGRIGSLHSEMSASTEEIAELRRDLESARRDAMTDGLTGIANRKCFDETLNQAVIAAMEAGEPLSLVFTDLDHFKRFNDTHGHQVGDQVLKLVARTLVSTIKGRDTAARYGGEEFAVILPNTSGPGASALAESLRLAVTSKRLYKKGSDEVLGAITLSLGVATFLPGEPVAEFVRRADAALYRAKNAGRNQVVVDNTRVLKMASG